MGNHEFCEDCHENDFHLGRPCNPIKLAAIQEQERKNAQDHAVLISKAVTYLNKLRETLPEAEFDNYKNIVIPLSSFRTK